MAATTIGRGQITIAAVSDGAPGRDGTSVTMTANEVRYSTVHNSASRPADSTFTFTDAPALSAGQYLWSRTKVTYSNGQGTVTYAVSRIGENGADGADGSSYTNNLLRNSDFKDGTRFYQLHANVTLDTSRVLDGRYSVKSSQSGSASQTYAGLIYHDTGKTGDFYPAKPGDVFTFSLWTYTDDRDALNEGGCMEIWFHNASGRIRGANRSAECKPAANGVWQHFHCMSAVAPEGAISVEFRAHVRRDGTLWFNGLKAEYGENTAPVWSPFAEGTVITDRSVRYAKTAANTQPADSAFTATSVGALNLGAGDYMWVKTEVTYSDGNVLKSYAVSRIGSDGADAVAGLHLAYADDVTGTLPHPTAVTGFSTAMKASSKYIGIYNDDKEADSPDFKAYEWARFRGENGISAKVVTVNADSTVFSYEDDFKTLAGTQNIKLSATLQGTSGYQWSYRRASQSAFTNISGATSSAYTLAHNASIWGTGTTEKSITLRCTSGGVYDEVTIYRVSSGSKGAGYTENLLVNSALADASEWTLHPNVTIDSTRTFEGRNSAKSDQSGLTANNWRGISQRYEGMKPGEVYTGSIWVYCENIEGISNGADLELQAYQGYTRLATGYTSAKPTKAGEWQQVKTKLTIPEGTDHLQFVTYVTRNGTLWMSSPKLERGDNPAPVWTPSPADGDAYTVILTNESHVFEGDTQKAIAASTVCGVEVYKGNQRVAATVGSITGAPAGMSVSNIVQPKATAAGSFKVNVTTALTQKQGTLTVPVTVDGKTFDKVFSWSLSLQGRGISGTPTEWYAVNNSSTTPPAESAFVQSPIPQTTAANRYLWNYEITTYTDNTIKKTDPHVVAVHGQNGADGAGIAKIENFLLASDKAHGVTTSTAGWTLDASSPAATVSAEKPYLWNYEKITYTKGSPTQTDPHVVGRWGSDAQSIYLRGTQLNRKEDGNPAPPIVRVNGKDLISGGIGGERGITLLTLDRKTLAKVAQTTYDLYANPDAATADLVAALEALDDTVFATLTSYDCITVTQELADKLANFGGIIDTVFTSRRRSFAFIGYKGCPKGCAQWVIDKADGTADSAFAEVSVYVADGMFTTTQTAAVPAKITEQYYLSTSRTTPTGGSWSDTRQPWVAGHYYWTRVKITYTDGTVEYTGEVCATGEAGVTPLMRYSATGGSSASEWHPTPLPTDRYVQTSTDGGATWSPAYLISPSGYTANLLLKSGEKVENSSYPIARYNLAEKPVVGETYTITVWGELGAGKSQFEAYNSGGYISLTGLKKVSDGVYSKIFVWKNAASSTTAADTHVNIYAMPGSVSASSRIDRIKLERGSNPNPVWTPAASEMQGGYPVFQWAKSNSATSAPTSGWQPTPLTALAGEYVWIRQGTVIPPATTPAKWENAVRLTGDKGAAGSDVYRLDLDNEMDAVMCDSAGNPVAGAVYPIATASVFKGATKLTSGVTYSIPQKSGITTATITQAGAITMSGITADRAEITVQAVVAGVTLTAIMTVCKVKAGVKGDTGAAAVVYKLIPSVDSVTRGFDGSLSHTQITCSVYKTTGASAPVLTADKTLRYTRLPDNLNGVLAHSGGVSGQVPLTADTTEVIFELCDGSTLLDRERVAVLTDARDIVLDGQNLLPYTNRGARGWASSVYPATSGGLSTGTIKVSSDTQTPGVLLSRSGGLNAAGNALVDPLHTTYQAQFAIPAGTLKAGTAYMLTFGMSGVTNPADIEVRVNRSGFTSQLVAFIGLFSAPDARDGELAMQLRFTTPSTTTFNAEFFDKTPLGLTFYIKPRTAASVWWTFRIWNLQIECGNVATAYKPNAGDTSYLTEALRGATTTEGGLMLTSQINLGEWDTTDPKNPVMKRVLAGMNGVYMKNEPGYGLMMWGGGGPKDADLYPGDPDAATSAIRMDGSAYFAGNTIRLGKDYAEIGDSIRLDPDGIKLIKDGTVRLLISNVSVDSFTQPSQQSVIPVVIPSLGFNFKYDPDPEDEAIGVYTLLSITGGERIDLNGGKEVPDNAQLDLAISFGIDASMATYMPSFNVYVELYDSAGTRVRQWSCQQERTDGDPYGINIQCSAAIHTTLAKGRYWLRIWPGYASQPDYGTVPATISAAVKATGGITPDLRDMTILAVDGFLTTWDNTALLAKKGRIMQRVGETSHIVTADICDTVSHNYGLRVSRWGIQKTSDYASDRWDPL